ncbi:MAG TPA: hypothetical protein VK898_11120 [Chloroflexota bacterium]|nr:hypothetical protein [Chloroflexota bacterium]
MAEASRSNRPTPRTPAAIEAELRRRIRAELAEARGQTEGELDDQTLAGIIARAIASALSWHLEAPEHTRNATMSSRTWRPAGGPRGGQSREETAERGPRDVEDRPRRPPPFRERNFEDRPPRGPYQERRPRDFEDRPPRGPYQERRPRDFDERPPRGPYQERGPRGGRPPGRGGGFGPRRPPRPR